MFHRSPTFSGSTTANLAGSTADRTSTEAFSGTHSQLLDIVYDEGSGADFFLRHVAGAKYTDFGGSTNAADRISNLQFENVGSVGFYLKTDDPGLQVSLALDDPSTGDRGELRTVIADGEWHRYEWFLGEDTQWESWAGGDGIITGDTISLDSIQFFGATDAQVYLDEIFWDSLAIEPPLEGDYDGDGIVGQGDLNLALLNWGFGPQPTPIGWVNDQPTSIISQQELNKVLLNWGNTSEATAGVVPEPASAALLGLGSLLLQRRRHG